MRNPKYALLSYSTNNIGDEIQSLAARQFLPRVDMYIDRDDLKKFRDNEKIKVILNGWFNPKKSNWPPSENIEPLFISFHVSKNAVKEFISPKSIAYLKKHEPIGCRDIFTQKILQENGVQAYFSGCLTLTLQRPNLERGNEIVIADVDEETTKFLPKEIKTNAIYTNHWNHPQYIKKVSKLIPSVLKKVFRIIKLNTLFWSNVGKIQNTEEKFQRARHLLEKYAKAKLVITSRLHCVLPCLAFNTPVIFIPNDIGDPRFNGFLPYLRTYSIDDLKRSGLEIDLSNPPPNPQNIKPLQEKLQRRCREFIG